MLVVADASGPGRCSPPWGERARISRLAAAGNPVPHAGLIESDRAADLVGRDRIVWTGCEFVDALSSHAESLGNPLRRLRLQSSIGR
jgi:hypothetical protein